MATSRCGLPRNRVAACRRRTCATSSMSSPPAARYRVEKAVTEVGPGDLLFAAAHTVHGFEELTDDFAIWIVYYGPVK